MKATSRAISEKVIGVDEFFQKLSDMQIPRVQGTALFLTRMQNGVPPVMRWHVARNRALQQKVVSLTIEIQNFPYVKASDRLVFCERAPGYWQGVARYGFMEQPHIPQLLQSVSGAPAPFIADEITWYLGHETIIARERNGMASWQRNCYAFMVRNSTHITNYYRLPGDQVVEIGRRVAI